MTGPACAPRDELPAPRVPDGTTARRRHALRRTRSPAVTTILLDIGGVVIPTLFESVAAPDFPSGALRDRDRPDPEYSLVERGELAERDYWARWAQRRPDLDIGELWRSCSFVRAEVTRLIERLSGRVRLAAFTNDMAHWFGADWADRFPILGAFDTILEAAVLGVFKPDPAAFRLAADALREEPGRCLFVDDLAVNLAGAAEAGMRTELFDVREPTGSANRILDAIGLRRRPAAAAGVRRPEGAAVSPVAGDAVLARLDELGLALPELRPRAGRYRGWVRANDLLFLAGQGADGWTGRVGDTLTVQQGYQAARQCALNLLAQIQDATGSFAAVRQIVQVRGYVTCTEDFERVPAVVDGASDLLGAIFGERGEHARTAIGVQALPLGFAVEVDMVVQLG